MNDQQQTEDNNEQRRDEILRRLLNTPPQPRPKRERSKSVTRKPKNPKKETSAN